MVVLAVCAVGALPGCGSDRDGAAESGPRTAPPASTNRAVVWAVGDGADGSDLAREVARLIARGRPDRFLYLGDVYDRGTAAEFKRNFGGVYGRLARIAEPTPGNHEWANRRTGYYPYWRRIKGRRQRPWYRFELGGWELYSLNSEAAHGQGSSQLRWLSESLRGAQGSCRLAFWHRPRFNAGTTYGDDAAYEPFWRALHGKARLVLSGHEHNMQRLRARDGIVPVISGAGGRNVYPFRRDDPRVRYASDYRRGAVRIVLEPGRASIEFVGTDGRVLDRSSVRCREEGEP